MKRLFGSVLSGFLCVRPLLAQGTKAGSTSPRAARFLTVEPGVQLEVKDWGGTGRPVVLLAGLGGTLHGYDEFAPELTAHYHVYGITRRGYGTSSKPEPTPEHYNADRLGDDVLSIIDQLHLDRPVLVGHSFAGEELSSVCSRFPQRVAGLVYLDAANRYAFSPPHRGDFRIDTLELKRALNESLDAISPAEQQRAIERLQAMLPQFQADLAEQKKMVSSAPEMSQGDHDAVLKERATEEGAIEQAALNGERRFDSIPCPTLAIFALPHDHGLPPGPKRDAVDAWEMQTFGPLADGIETGVAGARVIRIPHAQHAVYKSNEVQVVQEMQKFIGTLK